MREHNRHLALELILLQLGVAVRAHGNRCRIRQQVDVVVTGSCWREAMWLVEDVAVLLQEVGQEGVRLVERGRHHLVLRGRGPCTADARPLDAAASLAPADEGQRVEVPEYGAQCGQEVEAEDEVVAAQVDVDAVDGEVLVADEDGDLPSHTLARKAVPVGDGDAELLGSRRLQC